MLIEKFVNFGDNLMESPLYSTPLDTYLLTLEINAVTFVIDNMRRLNQMMADKVVNSCAGVRPFKSRGLSLFVQIAEAKLQKQTNDLTLVATKTRIIHKAMECIDPLKFLHNVFIRRTLSVHFMEISTKFKAFLV